MDGEYDGAYDIWGGDIDPKAVAIARANAEKADVEDVVRFEVADAAAFRRDAPYGRGVTKPPYGERILGFRPGGAHAAGGVAGERALLPHGVRAHLWPYRRQEAQAV